MSVQAIDLLQASHDYLETLNNCITLYCDRGTAQKRRLDLERRHASVLLSDDLSSPLHHVDLT